jgi:hypothetical protein
MVVVLIPSGILYMVFEQLNFFLRWGCLPHAQPPAILEDQCFLSDKFDIAREIFWCVSESVVSRWRVFPWYILPCVIAVCRVELWYVLFCQTQEEAEREVAEYLMKALKYCDVDTPGLRQPIYQFRAASIHHRLASLYHKSYRWEVNEPSIPYINSRNRASCI